jgi:hypothetical protein
MISTMEMEEVEEFYFTIIKPPVNGYNYTQTLYLQHHGITICGNPNTIYAQNTLALQQLSNGNVLFLQMVQQALK